MTPIVRQIAEADWAGIVELERQAYRKLGLSENPAVLRSRAATSPATSMVAEIGGELAGYLIALPYPPGGCPDLIHPETAAHESANLHLHDLVTDTRWRGRGLGGLLLDRLVRRGRDRACTEISLVAVGQSRRFWQNRGFVARPGVPLAPGYRAPATYMTRHLDREG
ncbi:GNAT superfamily N-acetyltransferase [Actinoplanes octamycinicus]|uniref:GNAT superfamily N-acetyltransferase n=1 Tax=Actinoplanes octamycinicus TaxID=135948 RepID=A0A7W7H4Z3_9ACTN|nr:GNAT family N-acetyltransferase [Actinoplanes octamycinicus]MBB4743952.1 GNAT superfamily N-acetyltransferase [Actinoplanes octamycinicus]GIE58576.1 N-acetyltransferase [Actinoplanes octamycinicus]